MAHAQRPTGQEKQVIEGPKSSCRKPVADARQQRRGTCRKKRAARKRERGPSTNEKEYGTSPRMDERPKLLSHGRYRWIKLALESKNPGAKIWERKRMGFFANFKPVLARRVPQSNKKGTEKKKEKGKPEKMGARAAGQREESAGRLGVESRVDQDALLSARKHKERGRPWREPRGSGPVKGTPE